MEYTTETSLASEKNSESSGPASYFESVGGRGGLTSDWLTENTVFSVTLLNFKIKWGGGGWSHPPCPFPSACPEVGLGLPQENNEDNPWNLPPTHSFSEVEIWACDLFSAEHGLVTMPPTDGSMMSRHLSYVQSLKSNGIGETWDLQTTWLVCVLLHRTHLFFGSFLFIHANIIKQ